MKRPLKIEIFDNNDNRLCLLDIKQFEINDDYIIKESELKYGTSDPCIIYRTCIINMLHIKLDDYIRLFNNNCVLISDLPVEILSGLKLPINAYTLRITDITNEK
jgi:hypothetical protein